MMRQIGAYNDKNDSPVLTQWTESYQEKRVMDKSTQIQRKTK